MISLCFLGALVAILIQELSPLDDAVWITVVLAVFCAAAIQVVMVVLSSVVPDSRTRNVVTAIAAVCSFVVVGSLWIYDNVSTVVGVITSEWAWLLILGFFIHVLDVVTKSFWAFLLLVLWLLLLIVAVIVAVL